MKNVLSGNYGDLQILGILVLAAAVVAIVSKDVMLGSFYLPRKLSLALAARELDVTRMDLPIHKL